VLEERYLDIVAAVDAEFLRNRRLHGEKIRCRAGCADCCHQAFQITEMEAASIAQGVHQLAPGAREALQARARDYIREAPGTRVACPALDQGVCAIYEFRPLMCHKFGMPIYNPDKPDRIFACELNFQEGEEIEDPELIQIQSGIHGAWKELQSDYREAGGRRTSKSQTVATAILEAS
jgi:uncharacterized protein